MVGRRRAHLHLPLARSWYPRSGSVQTAKMRPADRPLPNYLLKMISCLAHFPRFAAQHSARIPVCWAFGPVIGLVETHLTATLGRFRTGELIVQPL
jgi:hypothetical protein